MPRIALAAALGLGAGGALVDVSSYVKLEKPIDRTYGRTRQYDDIEPGSFSFVLDNQDGRFTPDNTASPYATTLAEGAAACIRIGTRLTPGRVQSIEPTFPEGEPGRAQVRVVCSDMLGDLSRDELANGWREAIVRAATPVGYYPLDDPEGGVGAADQSGTNRGTYLFEPTIGEVLFEQPGFEHDRIRITGEGSARLYGVSIASVSAGRYFSFWIEPISTGGTFSLTVAQLTFAMTSGFFQLASDFPSVISSLAPVEANREYFIEVDSVNLTLTIDGVLQGTLAGTTVTPYIGDPVDIFWGDATPTDFYWSDFALTQAPVRGDVLQRALRGGGAARWLELLDAASNQLTLATLPAGLALAPLFIEPAGDAGLDVLNQIMKAEQGHAYSTGTGTLLAPTEVVTIRERTRPETVSASFDVAADLKDPPQFERPIRDLVSRVEVRTPFGRITVTDPAIAARAGSASSSESIALASDGDARAWAQDRIIRGSNTRLQAMSIVIDAMTTQTDRSADLLALKPGDRIRLTNLPTTQLGYSSWDAWVVGAKETHGLTTHTFELHIAPVLDAPHVFDTARFASGTSIKLGRSVRTNLAKNPCTGGTLGLLSGDRATLTDGGTFVRATISDAATINLGQIIFVPSSSAAASPIRPGDVVTAQAEGRASVHPHMCVVVQFLNASLGFISGSSTQGVATSVNATTFAPLSAVTATAPPGAAFVRWLVGLAGTAPRAIGDTFDARRVMVEIAPAAYPYFDGDTTDTADAAYDWAGTPKQSPSTEKRQTMTTTATVIEASTLGPLLTTTEEPFDILIGSEQMTVVDVAGSSSPQTVQLVRGVNGTAAAGHASGDPIEVAPTAVFAF